MPQLGFHFDFLLIENISLSWNSLNIYILIFMEAQYVSFIHWKIPSRRTVCHIYLIYSWKIQKDVNWIRPIPSFLVIISKRFFKEVFINGRSIFSI